MITREQIENLGFKFILKDEESGDDITYNKNYRRGKMVIVHHPSNDGLTISTHGMFADDFSGWAQLYTGTVTTKEQLETELEKIPA